MIFMDDNLIKSWKMLAELNSCNLIWEVDTTLQNFVVCHCYRKSAGGSPHSQSCDIGADSKESYLSLSFTAVHSRLPE